MSAETATDVGVLLRAWRQRRRLSQLDLSLRADISTRHLSCVETGRSRPTQAMILRLCDHLDVPLRERNQALLAGGYAPAYPEHTLAAPELEVVRRALTVVLDAHMPAPALLLNRWWEAVEVNDAVLPLLAGCAERLLEPPINVLRLSVHPDGLAPRIINLAQWRGHLMEQLRRRIEHTGDPRLAELEMKLREYPGPEPIPPRPVDVVLPLRLQVDDTVWSCFTLDSRVGTATDVTVDELVVECLYPADDATRGAMAALHAVAD